ncbi:MAG: serine/threonine protein kinase [Candidatus Nanoarchaeia archaeon]
MVDNTDIKENDEIIFTSKIVVGEKLAEGGMGSVYKGFIVSDDYQVRRQIALKVPKNSNQAELSAFRKEQGTLSILQHDNIASMVDSRTIAEGPHQGKQFIAMQMVNGPDLSELIEMHGLTEDRIKKVSQQDLTVSPYSMIRFPEKLIAFIAFMAARGAAYSHKKGLINRDIKPENIMVERENGFVKLIDMGIAEYAHILQNAEILSAGTPFYMAPELFCGEPSPATQVTDVFSMGAAMFQAATGIKPFSTLNDASSIQDIMYNVYGNAPEDGHKLITPIKELLAEPTGDPVFSKIVSQCLDYNPKQRFQSMDDLGSFLTAYLYDGGVGPTIESLATYISIIDRWKQKASSDPRNPVTLDDIEMTREERSKFPFYENIEDHLLQPYKTTPIAKKALSKGENPAFQKVHNNAA